MKGRHTALRDQHVMHVELYKNDYLKAKYNLFGLTCTKSYILLRNTQDNGIGAGI